MTRKPLAGLLVTALTIGTLLCTSGPAQAAGTIIYVNNQTTCSDTGTLMYYCTINAATAVALAGQTVYVQQGFYNERVTFPHSGEPGKPIGLHYGNLSGPGAGITIAGQHDIVIDRVQIQNAVDVPAIDISDASGVAIQSTGVTMDPAATGTAVRMAAVTDSSLLHLTVAAQGQLTRGVSLDPATTGVTITSSQIYGNSAGSGTGIDIAGSHNSVVSSILRRWLGTGIAVEPGATGTVIANNSVVVPALDGIRSTGAAGTAIANNAVSTACRTGIRVDGGSTGVSVQNNITSGNGPNGRPVCDPSVTVGAEIGVYDGATGDTVVDYNVVYHFAAPSTSLYGWGVPMSLADFRTASGQGAHDFEEAATSIVKRDSANSAAPGYPATDWLGTTRQDDPATPNTGAGPVPYADRGLTEAFQNPTAALAFSPGTAEDTVTADASASTPGWTPIASYRFDFGDGTVVTQQTPVASHRYTTSGTYLLVTVTVTGIDGRWAQAARYASPVVYSTRGTVTLIALADSRYVTSGPVGTGTLYANRLTAGQSEEFDLIDLGSTVVLRSRRSRMCVTTGSTGTAPLSATNPTVGYSAQFTLVYNPDGTVSLQARVDGRYVTVASAGAPALVADGITIGPWQKFLMRYVLEPSPKPRSVTANPTTNPRRPGPVTVNSGQRSLR